MTAKVPLKVHLRLWFGKREKAPHCGALWPGLRALATAALYLVLKSNGFHHSENLPVKFVFSSKTVPANIAQKLPSQRCSQPFLIPLFNFSHKRPTFAFTGESGYTLGFRRKIAHKGTHGETEAFPPSVTARSCAASEIPFIPPCFYIHTFPGSLWPLTIGRREKVSEDATATLSPTIPHCVFQLRSQTAHVCFHEQKRVHTHLRQQDRTQRLTRRNRGDSDGGAITTLGLFHTFQKPCVARG